MRFAIFRYLILSFCFAQGISSAFSVYAAEDGDAEVSAPKYVYFDLSPDIVTNFVASSNRLGYLRMSASLMVSDAKDLAIVERHQPLIRDAIIEIVGRQSEAKVTSLAGREDIRQECLKQIHRLMIEECNRKVVINLLFTKYFYD